MERHEWSFASLLGPVDREIFQREYWGQQPLHVVRGCARFYESLISLADIERHLSMPEAFSRHSVTTPRQGYGMPAPPPASLSDVYERLLDGSSLRLRRMECFLDPATPLMSLVRGMAGELQHPLESLSCYVARTAAAGLGPHHDETEIFTLQISGRKRWRLYHRSPSDGAGIYDPADVGEPLRELMLEAGDLLYVPRGVIHDVVAEEAAFSVTIVFDPFRWRSVLDVLSARLSTTAPFLDALPAGALLCDAARDGLRTQLDSRLALIREALDAISVDDVIDTLAEQLVARMAGPAADHIGAVLDLETMALETVVERTRVPCHVARRGDRVRVTLAGGYRIQASIGAEVAIRGVLATAAPFPIRDMHDSLSGAAKLALARKLLACGLLTPVAAGRP